MEQSALLLNNLSAQLSWKQQSNICRMTEGYHLKNLGKVAIETSVRCSPRDVQFQSSELRFWSLVTWKVNCRIYRGFDRVSPIPLLLPPSLLPSRLTVREAIKSSLNPCPLKLQNNPLFTILYHGVRELAPYKGVTCHRTLEPNANPNPNRANKQP